MRTLRTRQEIAQAINGRKIPVVKIDLANADDYGLKSEPVVIDCGTFDDGFPYMIDSVIRAYSDEGEFKFSAGGFGIHADFTYHDMDEMLTYRNAPVIYKDEDVLLCIVDSKSRNVYKPMILHTSSHIDKFCSTPLAFEDKDYTTIPFLEAAGVEIRR